MRKYILGLIALACLAWIAYVGLNIVSGRFSYSPSTIFTIPGEKIVVLHKGAEQDFSAPEFAPIRRNPLYLRFFAVQERIQHFYFSGTRDLVILERSKPWTTDLVRQYFRNVGIPANLSSARTFALTEGFSARFDSHFLTVYKELPKLSEAGLIDWKYADKKSAATIVEWENDHAQLVNCYFAESGMIRFISESGGKAGKLINDPEVFADVVPDDIHSYTFFEKSYAKQKANPALSELVESGFVKVSKQDLTCIIFDILPGVDPIAGLGEQIDESSINEEKTEAGIHMQTPSQLSLNEHFYLRVFNNRVFMANGQDAINWCVGAYEAGRTLLQNKKKYDEIYAESPALVSFREVEPGSKRTSSLLDKSVYRTLILFAAEQEESAGTEAPQTVHIEGGIQLIYPVQGSRNTFVLSRSGKLFLVSNGQAAALPLSGEIVGTPQWIDNNGLLLTTTTHIHLFNTSGQETAGYPVALNSPARSAAALYSWKGKSGIVIATEQGIEQIVTTDNKRNVVKISGAFSDQNPVVWVSGGKLAASLLTDKELITVDLAKKRIRARFAFNGSAQLVKWSKQPVILIQKDGVFTLVNPANQQIGKTLPGKPVGKLYDEDGSMAINRDGKVFLLNGSGEITAQLNANNSNIEWISRAVRSRYAVLDGISNKIYLYRENGHLSSPEAYNGSAIAELQSDNSGKLWLLTVSNDFLVRCQIK